MLILMLGVAVAGALGVAIWFAGDRDLEAETWSHDFGAVFVPGEEVVLEHTFTLRNTSDEMLVIEDIRSTCGCTTFDERRLEIAPGEAIDLPVTFTVGKHGRKVAHVLLNLGEDRGVRRLTVAADVVRGPQLLAFSLRQTWPAGETNPTLEYMCFANVFTSPDPPAPPSVDADPALDVDFQGWTLRREGDPAKKWAWEWRGVFRVTRLRPHDDPALMTIILNEAQRATVEFRHPGAAPSPSEEPAP